MRAVKSSVFRIRNDCQVLFYTYKEFVLMMFEHDSLVKTKLFKNKKYNNISVHTQSVLQLAVIQ